MPKKKLKDTMEDRIMRRMGMLIETLQTQIGVVAEGHGQLRRQMEEMRDELRAEMRQGFLEHGVALRQQGVSLRSEMRTGFRRLDDKIDRVEEKLGTILQDHEKRINGLEEKSVA